MLALLRTTKNYSNLGIPVNAEKIECKAQTQRRDAKKYEKVQFTSSQVYTRNILWENRPDKQDYRREI